MEGVLVASITPRIRGSATVDVEGLCALAEFYQRHHVSGIVAFGTTGEFTHFAAEEKLRALRALTRVSAVPVLINVSDSCFDTTVAMARSAAESGAAAALVLPPTFFRYSQADLEHYFLMVAEAVGDRLPLYLYNIPAFTGALEAETAVRLIDTGRFAGIKDSSGETAFIERVLRAGVGRLYLGADGLIATYRPRGASGAVSGIAAAVPELMVALDAAAMKGDAERTATLQALLLPFIERFLSMPIPMLVKQACEWRGLPAGEHSIPLSNERGQQMREHHEWFEPWLARVLTEVNHR